MAWRYPIFFLGVSLPSWCYPPSPIQSGPRVGPDGFRPRKSTDLSTSGNPKALAKLLGHEAVSDHKERNNLAITDAMDCVHMLVSNFTTAYYRDAKHFKALQLEIVKSLRR